LSDVLEKMKRAHNLKMQKLKLKGELSIEEDRIKEEIALNKLNAKRKQMDVSTSIRELKTIVKQDRSIINAGTFLVFWGTLGTIISTLLTIAGLWRFFSTSYLKSISFILSIVMTQFTVFILAKQDTNIKRHFSQHVFKVGLLKAVLLSISIYGNYTFFTTGRDVNIIAIITTLALCIAIDVISIYCISIAQDFKTLNKNVSKDSLYTGLLGKIFYNLTCKFINSIESKYRENKKTSISVKDKGIEKNPPLMIKETIEVHPDFVQDKDTENKLTYEKDVENEDDSTFVNDKDLTTVKNAILNYRDGNVCPSVNALIELTKLGKQEILDSKKILVQKGMIKTRGTKTYIQNMEVLGNAK